MKEVIVSACAALGAIIFAILGLLLISCIINFLPATIIYFVVHILGFSFGYWQVYWSVYLLSFIGNLVFNRSIEKK